MKTIQFFLAFFLTTNMLQAQDAGLYWKYKEYDGAIGLIIPRGATFVGSAFVDEKENRQLVRKIRKARVLFFEEKSPFKQKDLKRFVRKAKRRHLDQMLTVRTGKTFVSVFAKERRNAIRKVVVLIDSPDGSGLVSVRGKFTINDINRIIQQISEEGKKRDGDDSVPDLPKIPVIRG